jgi:hypothetical protein
MRYGDPIEKVRRKRRRRLLASGAPMLTANMRSRSRTLLIAFGGRKSRLGGIPPFEFLSLASQFRAKRLFVRDLQEAWYHEGLPGYGEDVEGVKLALERTISEHRVERVVCCGNSAGGYGALLFGTLLRADLVLAFCPQTVIDLELLRGIGDDRWDEPLEALNEKGALEARWLDLGQGLPGAREGSTRYQVYFDETHEADRWHCERLRGLEGLRLYRFGHGGHELVKGLREAGALERILAEAIEGSSGGVARSPGRRAAAGAT